jgi:hypothetical protein
VREDAPEDDNGEPLLLKLDEEDAPRLAAGQRAKLSNGRLDGGGVLVLQPEVGGVVVEG